MLKLTIDSLVRSPPTPRVRGSNPANGNIYIEHLSTVNCIALKGNLTFLKIGQLRSLFRLFSVFSDKQYNFNNKSM